ncbi:MAG: hypothetical protein BGO49_10600 [Planctomycetales bacterium 71-10]|nr:MAG: hypothetical protein BGO49_10600 [Planctomycetales bacterium 71-10]
MTLAAPRLAALAPVLALALALAPGCGGDPNPPNSPELYNNTVLSELGDMISTYNLQHKKPPQGVKDLAVFAESLPTGLGAARRGDAVVLWGVAPVEPGSSGAEGQEILAYLKEAPESGGGVLTRDLQVKSLTADEFKAAPKAAGKIEDVSKAGKKKGG